MPERNELNAPGAVEPGGHSAHAVRPTSSANEPFVHAICAVAPAVATKRPLSAARQVVKPV